MISTAKVRDILEAMYPQRRTMVPCFIGAPGIGKTQGIYEFAEDHGVKVVTFILSNTVPSEVSGMRMPDNATKKMEVFDDLRMASLEDGDILFFDEILEAPPMLWSACLTLIQDRIMASGRKLPDVFIVAASNPVASAGIIPASVRNRFQWCELRFDSGSCMRWFYRRYGVVPEDALVRRIESYISQYNILTPREVTRLYEWCKDGGDLDVKRMCIEEWYDADVARLIMSLASSKPSGKKQIYDALSKFDTIILPSAEAFESLTYKEILSRLQDMPNWEEVQEILKGVEFDGEEIE